MTRDVAAMFGAALLVLAGCGGGDEIARVTEPAHKIVDTSLGQVLATNRGMTLYTYAKDTTPGVSACDDGCELKWPPLIALDDAKPVGKWTVVQRAEGLKQWAYDGKPLYGWHEDKKQGDTGGDGQGDGAWTAARP